LPDVDLHFLARRAFHPPHRQLQPLGQAAHAAFDRLIAAGEPVLAHQILVDALRREPDRDRGGDDRLKLATQTHATGRGAGGRYGRFCPFTSLRAEGRTEGAARQALNGWVCVRILARAGGRNGRFCRAHIAPDRPTIDLQLARNAPVRPAAGVEIKNGCLKAHVEEVHLAPCNPKAHRT
jgi:hypothetical protein